MTNPRASKLEAILRNEGGSAGGGQTQGQVDIQSSLEKELAAEDTELAKELQRTRAEEMIQRRRLAIARMEEAGHRSAQSQGVPQTPERGKEWLVEVAQGLLTKNVDPNIVGRTLDYLLGISGSPGVPIGLPGAPAPAQGITFSDVKEIFRMGQESTAKSDPAIANILDRLSLKVEALEKTALTRPAPAPEKRTVIVVKSDGTFEEVELGKPIIIQPKPASDRKSIEEIKEENRHAEEVAKLEADKEYKNSVAHTLASIPEKIGRGLAGQVAEGGGEETAAPAAANRTIELEPFTCKNEECGKVTPIPKNATKFTCPHCGSIYERQEEKGQGQTS